jgi:hypothetical protein
MDLHNYSGHDREAYYVQIVLNTKTKEVLESIRLDAIPASSVPTSLPPLGTLHGMGVNRSMGGIVFLAKQHGRSSRQPFR